MERIYQMAKKVILIFSLCYLHFWHLIRCVIPHNFKKIRSHDGLAVKGLLSLFTLP